MRTHVTGQDRKDLNHIVHSGDRDPHKHGTNPYADKTNSYDPEAQKTIDRIKKSM